MDIIDPQSDKPVLRLSFADMWGHDGYLFYGNYNYFYSLLSIIFKIELVLDEADLLIFSSYGRSYLKKKAKVKLYFSNEILGDVSRDPNSFDIQLGIQPISRTKKFIFFPHWCIYINWFSEPNFQVLRSPYYLLSLNEVHHSGFFHPRERLDAICSIYSNPIAHRLKLLKLLGTYFSLDNYGPVLNNTGGPLCGTEFEKLRTIALYKATVVSENTDIDGYVSEKIFHAFAAGAFPIYQGGAAYREYVNTDCVIDVSTLSERELIDNVQSLLHERGLHSEFLKRPKLKMDRIAQYKPSAILEQLLAAMQL